MTDWVGDLCFNFAMPKMRIVWCVQVRQRLCVMRSEMNEADDAESRKALASTVEPSGASINI